MTALSDPTVAVSTTSPDAASDSTSSSSPAVRVDRLSYKYAGKTGVQALSDVRFAVPAGQRLALLGPNGSGKSTLLKLLSTALPPQGKEAAVNIAGADLITQPDVVRRHLGVVFQNPAVDGKLTVRENLALHGRLYGLRNPDLTRRIDHWLERFDIADRRDAYVESLSGGLRRRVELAKAMLPAPKVLLLDEPSTGLDPTARRELTDILDQLRGQDDVTALLSTHLIDEAAACDLVAVMAAGRLVRLGEPGELCAAVGGQVLRVQLAAGVDTSAVAAEISERFGPWSNDGEPRPVGRDVVAIHEDAPSLVASILETLGRSATCASVGRPTLEDVYFDATGATLAE